MYRGRFCIHCTSSNSTSSNILINVHVRLPSFFLKAHRQLLRVDSPSDSFVQHVRAKCMSVPAEAPPFCIIGYAYVVCSEIRCCFRFFKFIGANTDCNQCANDHSRNKKGKKQPKVIHCNTSAINRFYGRTSLFTVSVSATNSGTVFKSAFPFRKSAAVF